MKQDSFHADDSDLSYKLRSVKWLLVDILVIFVQDLHSSYTEYEV